MPMPRTLAAARPTTEPVTVLQAVIRTDTMTGDELVFLKSAFDSAADSPYAQPAKVYRALLVMAEVAREVRRCRRAGCSAGRLEDLFRSRGFDYRSHQSQTTRGKWGREYQAVYQGRLVSVEPHLALGKGGPKTCLRIYFHIDDAADGWRLVVAHVGRHKTNTRS